MAHIAHNKNPPKMPDNVTPEAQDFLERCWERDPLRRPNCDRLLAHPFIAGSRNILPGAAANASAAPEDMRDPMPARPPPTPRVHPAVGAHPSPIQEEVEERRGTAERTPSASQHVGIPADSGPCTLLCCCSYCLQLYKHKKKYVCCHDWTQLLLKMLLVAGMCGKAGFSAYSCASGDMTTC